MAQQKSSRQSTGKEASFTKRELESSYGKRKKWDSS